METVHLDSKVGAIELPLAPQRVIEIYGFDSKSKKQVWRLVVTNKGKLALM